MVYLSQKSQFLRYDVIRINKRYDCQLKVRTNDQFCTSVSLRGYTLNLLKLGNSMRNLV